MVTTHGAVRGGSDCDRDSKSCAASVSSALRSRNSELRCCCCAGRKTEVKFADGCDDDVVDGTAATAGAWGGRSSCCCCCCCDDALDAWYLDVAFIVVVRVEFGWVVVFGLYLKMITFSRSALEALEDDDVVVVVDVVIVAVVDVPILLLPGAMVNGVLEMRLIEDWAEALGLAERFCVLRPVLLLMVMMLLLPVVSRRK